MNTARIVVLTIAIGAVSSAATNSARGAVSGRPSSAEPTAHLLGSALALNTIAAPDILQSSSRDDRASRRGDNTNVTTQK